jgi:hypothetical protein
VIVPAFGELLVPLAIYRGISPPQPQVQQTSTDAAPKGVRIPDSCFQAKLVTGTHGEACGVRGMKTTRDNARISTWPSFVEVTVWPTHAFNGELTYGGARGFVMTIRRSASLLGVNSAPPAT